MIQSQQKRISRSVEIKDGHNQPAKDELLPLCQEMGQVLVWQNLHFHVWVWNRPWSEFGNSEFAIDWFWDPIFRANWDVCDVDKLSWDLWIILGPHWSKRAILVQSAHLWISQPDFQTQFILLRRFWNLPWIYKNWIDRSSWKTSVASHCRKKIVHICFMGQFPRKTRNSTSVLETPRTCPDVCKSDLACLLLVCCGGN